MMLRFAFLYKRTKVTEDAKSDIKNTAFGNLFISKLFT